MKKLHYILLASVVFACVISACSKKDGQDEMTERSGRRQVLSDKKDIERISSPSPTPKEPAYLLRLENSTLTLYEVTSEETLSLKTVNIDPSYYPPEDIKELNTGIPAYSKEEGFIRLENFVN